MSQDIERPDVPSDEDQERPQEQTGAGYQEEHEEVFAEREDVLPRSKADQWRNNVIETFGSGIGRIALIAFAVVALILGALGYRSLTNPEIIAPTTSQVDVPNAPPSRVSVEPVVESEAIRRADQSALEANAAIQQGSSYQAGFDPHIVPDQQLVIPTDPVSFNIPGQPGPEAAAVNPQINVGAGQSGSSKTQSSTNQNGKAAQAEAKAREQAEKAFQKELSDAQKERDKWKEEIRAEALKEISKVLGEQGTGNVTGRYSMTTYYTPKKPSADNTTIDENGTIRTAQESTTSTGRSGKGKPVIKTGNTMYFTNDGEINTDDGGVVIATIHGGEWDKSKILGKIEQGPNNIRAVFTTLAPQDSRPTMKIQAIALREEDAKQGIAENIDHHILERYGSLAAASLLSGYGRAYANTGTTLITGSGAIAQTQDEPDTQKVIASAVGEMGTQISSQIRRNFNRPPTYSTPAERGFVLFFMQDVYSD